MKAVILAAGMGKRLKDITLNIPKPLLKIANTTIIEYLISSLKEIGVKDIFVVTGYKSKLMKKKIGSQVTYLHNKKYKTTNSIYSLYLAKKYLQNSDFILANGDILLSQKCLSKVNSFKSSTSFGIKRNIYSDGEMNIISKNRIIKQISKDIDKAKSNAESAQISYFKKKDSIILFNRVNQLIRKKMFNLFPAYAYDVVIKKSKLKISFINKKCWYEIDTRSDLVKLRKKIKTIKQLEFFKNSK